MAVFSGIMSSCFAYGLDAGGPIRHLTLAHGTDTLAQGLPVLVVVLLGGTAWYLQFFFYIMGESQMGRYAFSSWTLHMSSIIIFATLWGLALKEWKGASARSLAVMTLGLVILIGATVVIGVGNKMVVQG